MTRSEFLHLIPIFNLIGKLRLARPRWMQGLVMYDIPIPKHRSYGDRSRVNIWIDTNGCEPQ